MTIYDNDFDYDGSWTYEDLNIIGTTGSQCGDGWVFFVRDSSGALQQISPTITGEMSFDISRDVRRTISGQVLLPAELRKFNINSDEIYAFLIKSNDAYQMGVFRASEIVIQPDVILDPDTRETADLIHVSWADRMIRLRANDGTSQTIFAGADPAQEMGALLTQAGVPHALANSVSITSADLTWDGSASLYDKITSLANLAGHRPPWPDNRGVLRSDLGSLDPTQITQLEHLLPVVGSISITENYLTAPNRVIVTDNAGSPVPIRGEWNAPSSAPHSALNRGWVQTEIQQIQGVSTSGHADDIARQIGENYTGRSLSCDLAKPTSVLDGPVFLRFADALWMVISWSVSLAPNSVMRLQAVEFFSPELSTEVGRPTA